MSRLATEHRIVELLLHRLDLIEWEAAAEELDSEDLRIARRAREILLGAYADPPTLPRLARLCGTNDFRLKRVFRLRHGTTVGGYVRRLRLEAANRLLREGGLSVSEVAERVGYRHRGHFSRLFYEQYGFHPKALIKNPASDRKKSRS